MKKLLQLTLLLALVLPMSACRKAAQKAASKIRLEAVERVTPKGFTAVEAVLRVANGTSYKLALEQATIRIHYRQSDVLVLTLHEAVGLGKKRTESLTTRWKVQIADPLALLLLARDVKSGDPSQIAVSARIEGRGGPARVNLDRQMVPLSEFLRTFDLSMEDLNNYLPF